MDIIRKAAMRAQADNATAKRASTFATAPNKSKSPVRRKSIWAKISVNSKSKARTKLKMRMSLSAALKQARVNVKTTYDSEVFRIVVMGANGTGKTALCSRVVGSEPNADKGSIDRLLISSANPSAMPSTNRGFGGDSGVGTAGMTLDPDIGIGLGMMVETTPVLYQARPSAVVVSESVIEDDNVITVTHNNSTRAVVVGSGVFEATADVPKAHELDDPQVKYAYKTAHGHPEFNLDQPEQKDYEVYAARVSMSAHNLADLTGLTGLTGISSEDQYTSLAGRAMSSMSGVGGMGGMGGDGGRASSMRGSRMNRARTVRNDAEAKMARDYGVQLVEAPDNPFNEDMGIASGGVTGAVGGGGGNGGGTHQQRRAGDDAQVDEDMGGGYDDHDQFWDDEMADLEEEAHEHAYNLVHEAITSLGVSTTTLQEKDPRTANDEDEEGRFGNLFLGYEFGTLINPIARRDAKRETTDRENAKGHNPTNTLWMNCIAGAAIIMYDIRKPQTFARARALCREIHTARQSTGGSRPVPILIIANFSDMVSSLVYDYGKDEDLITSEQAFFAHGTMAGNRVVHQGHVHTVVELVHRVCVTMKDMQLFKLGPKKIVAKEQATGGGGGGGGVGGGSGTKEYEDGKDKSNGSGQSRGEKGGMAKNLSATFNKAASSVGGEGGGGAGGARKDKSGLGWCW